MRGGSDDIRRRHDVGSRRGNLPGITRREHRWCPLKAASPHGEPLQPHDLIVIPGERWVLIVMRSWHVRLEVPMDGWLWMVGGGLVNVFGYDNRREGETRRHNEADKGAAERGSHVRVIMDRW